MANDVLKFVDSIAASPTTRLDLNTTSSGWKASVIDPGVPPTSLSVAQNAMRDGGWVSSSVRGMRTITLGLTMTSASQDTNATAIQNLVRELDRESNYLMFQPDGASKPVFFRTYRATPATIQYVWSAVAHHAVEIQLQADPWALGLRETVSVGTVNNNPAAASNGCYFDVAAASCIGDVPAPFVMVDTADATTGGILAIRQRGTVTDLPRFVQAESFSSLYDTANPGGGPDAAMSGTGTNNYLRTAFTDVTGGTSRMSYTFSGTSTNRALAGSFRLLAVVRRSGSSSTMTVRATVTSNLYVETDWVTIPKSTDRQVVDLGLITFGTSDTQPAANSNTLDIFATRSVAGAETLDWDYFALVPADTASLVMKRPYATDDLVISGEEDRIYSVSNGANLFTTGTTESTYSEAIYSGAIPLLAPNITNRITWIKYTASTGAIDKSLTGSVTLYYYPRYLFIRPSAT